MYERLAVWECWSYGVCGIYRWDQIKRQRQKGGGSVRGAENWSITCIKCFAELNSCSSSVRYSMLGSVVGVLVCLFSSWLICQNAQCSDGADQLTQKTPNMAQKPLTDPAASLLYYLNVHPTERATEMKFSWFFQIQIYTLLCQRCSKNITTFLLYGIDDISVTLNQDNSSIFCVLQLVLSHCPQHVCTGLALWF